MPDAPTADQHLELNHLQHAIRGLADAGARLRATSHAGLAAEAQALTDKVSEVLRGRVAAAGLRPPEPGL